MAGYFAERRRREREDMIRKSRESRRQAEERKREGEWKREQILKGYYFEVGREHRQLFWDGVGCLFFLALVILGLIISAIQGKL